jgi:hypothetical protein
VLSSPRTLGGKRVTARWGAAISRVSAALLAPLLIVAPTHQAKASCDVLACGRLSADLFTGAAAAAWQILKSPECSSDLDDNIAVAAALLAIEELPKSPINTANCVGSLKAITDLVGKNAGNPAIKAALSFLTDNSAAQQYLDCACPLAAAGVDTINKIIADADACSSFSPSDCIGSLYGVFDKPQLTSPGGYCNYTIQCGPGTISNCMTANNWAQAWGSCTDNSGQGVICAPGLVVAGPPPIVDCVTNGPTQTCTITNFQSCTCPVGQAWQGDHCGVCPVTETTSKDELSANGLSMTHTSCTTTTEPSDDRLSCKGNATVVCTPHEFHCPAGQKVASWNKCTKACGFGQVYDSNGQCNTCPANTKTVFASADNSKGSCVACADGETSAEGSPTCTKLVCSPFGYQDPKDPHACVMCPGNQQYSPNSRKSAKGPKAAQAGTCGCGEAQVPEGNACVCAKGADKHLTTSTSFTCSCPAGAKMNYKTGACDCGFGKHVETVSISPNLGGGTASTCVLNSNTGIPIIVPVMPPNKKLQTAPPATTNKPFKCPPGSHPNPRRANSCLPDRPGATQFAPGGPPVFIPRPGISDGGGGGGHVAPGGTGIRR